MRFKKIIIDNVEKNMILAKDVVIKNGMIIYVKGWSLSDSDIEKLKKNNIEYIYVFEPFDINHFIYNNTGNFEERKTAIDERKEFKKFVRVYSERISKIKNSFCDLLNGKKVDLSNLYKNTSSIFEEVSCKEDIVNYIYHLKILDNYIYRHSINVSILCYLFAEWTNMSYNEKKDITIAGILHDIGKIIINQKILDKTSKLTQDEFYEMKKHTNYGFMLLIDQNVSDNVKLTALMHHEKLDGKGYPFGIKDSKIIDFAKIVSVCDIYDAMTSNRVYHKKKCPFQVLKEFEQNYYGCLDIKNVMTFSKHIAYSYIGSKVKLSNQQVAEIAFINQNNLSKPIVKIDDKFIDLCANTSLYIQSLI